MTASAPSKAVVPRWWQREQTGDLVLKAVVYILLTVAGILFMIPFAWMVSTAFKPTKLIFKSPPVWFVWPPSVENFREGWESLPFPIFYRNTIILSIIVLFGGLLSSSLAAFAYASLPARGKKTLFYVMLSTLMLPGVTTLIPTFVLFARLGWLDTWLPLTVPAFFGSAGMIFMFRQFFMGIPRDLYDSAEIDGCGPLRTYLTLTLPLSKPVLATAGIFTFMGTWNNFMGPLLYLSSVEKFPLALGLSLFRDMYYTRVEYLMPMTLVAVIPILVLFFSAQKYFVQSVVTTGLKF